MASTLERRGEPRHACVLGIKTINGKPISETYLLDITAHGAQITGNFFVVNGDEISIGLPIMEAPGGQEKLENVTGMVIWVQKTYTSPEELMRYRFGVSFPYPLKEMEKLLQMFHWREN